ncbi:hypothetical protein HY415_01375 [Candidatus Kaiserbacteria bacterium]|nr:hypothetical protein [Candidatus Kaiserbacteria bacterium]
MKTNELDELDELAEKMVHSQKLNRTLPVGTIERWAARIKQLTASLRGATGAETPQANTKRSEVTRNELPADFTVMPRYHWSKRS